MNTPNLSASHSLRYPFGLFPLCLPYLHSHVLHPSPSLAKYHTQLLTLSGDGTGSWTLARIGTAEARIGIDREIGMLESRLKEVEQWEQRVKELEVLLGPQGATPA
jgi:hypothetical protein